MRWATGSRRVGAGLNPGARECRRRHSSGSRRSLASGSRPSSSYSSSRRRAGRSSTTPAFGRVFRHGGYPDWFRVASGVLELSAVALLILGRTAAFGALIIIVIMLGGMTTHVLLDGGRNLTSEVVPLTLGTI